jgi:AhpC/TSA family
MLFKTTAFASFLGAAWIGVAGLALATDIAPGKPAPDFKARDSQGREVSLSSLKGKVVVLEWTNNGCPYVNKHYGSGNMQALQTTAAAKDVVWLSVISSAPGEQGHVSGAEADKIAAAAKAKPTATLLDPDGKLGRLFDAKTTPHMYVIDKSGTLAYMGAIDDKPTANQADIKGARNYLTEALDAVAAGKPVVTASTRPYGCSVKYSAAKS